MNKSFLSIQLVSGCLVSIISSSCMFSEQVRLVYWKQENRRCVSDDSIILFCKFTDYMLRAALAFKRFQSFRNLLFKRFPNL